MLQRHWSVLGHFDPIHVGSIGAVVFDEEMGLRVALRILLINLTPRLRGMHTHKWSCLEDAAVLAGNFDLAKANVTLAASSHDKFLL